MCSPRHDIQSAQILKTSPFSGSSFWLFDCGKGPMGLCVLIVLSSHRVHTESIPLVMSSGGIVPSIHLQTRVSVEIWRVHIEVTFALLLSLKTDSKKQIITHCSSLQTSYHSPVDFLLDETKQVISSSVSDDRWWTVVLQYFVSWWGPPVNKKGATILW